MKKASIVSLALLLAASFSSAPVQAATNKTISLTDTPGGATDVIVVNNYAYVSDGLSGITVVNVANSATPSVVTSVSLPDIPGALDATDTALFVADNNTVKILSLSNPAAPSVVGTYTSPDPGFLVDDVAVDGTHLYVLGTISGSGHLEAVNVSNLAAPSRTGTIAVNGWRSMRLSGSMIYAVGGTKLDAIDISLYPSMSILGTYTDASASTAFHGIQVINSYAYTNDEVNGLHAISVAQPTNMTQTFSLPSGTYYGYGVAVSNGYLFASIGTGNVAIYDIIASPSHPALADTYSTVTNAGGLTVADGIAYVTVGSSGLQLLDVNKPDVVPPTITITGGGGSGSTPPVITVGSKYTDPGATATDSVDGSLHVTVTGKVDTNTVGKYTLTYTATDRAGNVTTTTRTVIIAPSVTPISGKSGVYTQTVNGRRLTFRPFSGYRGTILARKLVVHKTTDPMFLFITTSPTGSPKLSLYNYKGALLSRVDLRTLTTKGIAVSLTSDPHSLSVLALINSVAAGTTARTYTISASGLRTAGTLTIAAKPSFMVVKTLKLYPSEYGMATMVRGKTSTIRIWRYNTKTKAFVRDAKYPLSKLKLTGTSIALKS